MQYWLVEYHFLSYHLFPPLSFLSGRFGGHKVHPSGYGSASFMHLVCGSGVAHCICWRLTLHWHLVSCLVSYFVSLGSFLCQFNLHLPLSQIFKLLIVYISFYLELVQLSTGRLPLLQIHSWVRLVRHPSWLKKVILEGQSLHSQSYP